MRRRRPWLRVQHVVIRFKARLHAGAAVRLPIAAAPVKPGVLRGQVDEPTPDEEVDRSGFTVRGWCTWGDRPAHAVAVCLDGVVAGLSMVGAVPRPDVATALDNEDLSATGWQARVAFGPRRSGEPADLSVLVWSDATAPPVVLDRFTVIVGEGTTTQEEDSEELPEEYVGALDRPRRDEVVGAAFPVRGWALRGREPVDRLDVLINGEQVGRARLGLARPDIEVDQPGPNAIVSGFEYWVDLSAVSSTEPRVTVQLVAGTADGSGVPIFERVVRVRPVEQVTQQSERESLHARRRKHLLSAIAVPRSSELNLVVFTHQLDYGGGQLWLDEFLKKAGAGTRFACTLISFKDGPLREAAERRGIAVHVTDEPPVDDVERYEGRITELAALVAIGGHNVALVNTAPVFSGADVASRLSLPTVWAIHESFPPTVLMAVAFVPEVHPHLFELARRTMQSAEALVFEAEATREIYGAWEGPGNAAVVPYGVDTRQILHEAGRASRQTARSEVGVRPESRLILVMGTTEQRKAQTRIAQAFGRIAQDHPDWSLVFVGDTKSQYSDALKKYVRTLRLGDRCQVAPVDRDTYRWYRAADVLLSASDVESLPRSMLEAMCFGVTVVGSSVFGVPELVRDGQTGFLFEPNDLGALEAALRRVLALDPSELERVGKAGQTHVLEHYDSAGYSDDLLRLCQGLLRFPGATPEEILSKRGPRLAGPDQGFAGSAEPETTSI